MPTPYRRILVSVDGSSRDHYVVQQALHVAGHQPERLAFIRVVEPIPEQIGWLAEGYPPPVDLQQLRMEQARTEMQGLYNQFHLDNQQSPCLIAEGQTYIEIIRQVLRGGHDLVIRAGDASHPFAKTIFGSTCRQLMRKCPVPVLAVKPLGDNRYHTVVAALGPPHTREETLNPDILQKAAELARLDGAQLHVVHVWQPEIFPQIPAWSAELRQQMEQWMQQQEQARKDWFAQTLQQAGVEKDARAHFLHGEPSLTLSEFVQQQQADLVVMGTVARTGIQGFLIGNTAEKLLQEIHCAILALKPEGFETPVRLDENTPRLAC